MRAKMGIADPSASVTRMGQSREVSDEEDPLMEEDVFISFASPELAPDTAFHFSLAPEKKFVNGLRNTATYYTAIRKVPKATA